MSYGDSRLWYVVAEANGLTGNQDLKAGQVLRIPATESSANAADTFKPYDPSKVVGDTSPFLPAPAAHGGGCGGVGQIIMIVVAVVVTIYTAGALSGATGGFISTMEAGGAALAGGSVGTSAFAAAVGNVGVAATAGAVGSIASQAVGIAIGNRRAEWV
jgi:hypothetical protein